MPLVGLEKFNVRRYCVNRQIGESCILSYFSDEPHAVHDRHLDICHDNVRQRLASQDVESFFAVFCGLRFRDQEL